MPPLYSGLSGEGHFLLGVGMYEARTYRREMKPGDLFSFRVVDQETDLQIAVGLSPEDEGGTIAAVREEVARLRKIMTDYEKVHPGFIRSLAPLAVLPGDDPVIERMKRAGEAAGVGPMASVAGCISAEIGAFLLDQGFHEVLIENGGDLFLCSTGSRRVAIETGPRSPFKHLQLLIEAAEPLGVCTSSGTRGHSLSFGLADAATVISQDVYLADACATALGNRIKSCDDFEGALDWIQTIPGVLGAVVVCEDKMGAWGEVTFV